MQGNLNWMLGYLDPNRFCKCKEREKERDWYMHILSGKSKCIDSSTSREREREREGGSFCISSFFNSENSSTYFKVSCISLQKILIDEMSLSDCITLYTAFAQMESKRKLFGFLKEERKCRESSVVRGQISVLLRFVS